jgi:hypothetical protein
LCYCHTHLESATLLTLIAVWKRRLAQFENKEWKDVDWRRNAAFGLFGLFYLGGVQYFIYGAVD